MLPQQPLGGYGTIQIQYNTKNTMHDASIDIGPEHQGNILHLFMEST